MMSEASRMCVAGGLLIGALALAALGLQFGNRESAAKDAGGRADSVMQAAARPVMPDAPVADPRSAGIMRTLQAVRDSLQRGDLASARVLLDAVQTIRGDEPQALLLQNELAARETKTRETKTRDTAAQTAADDHGAANTSAHAHASIKTPHARAKSARHEMQALDKDDAAPASAPLHVESTSATDLQTAGGRAAVGAAAAQTHDERQPVIAAPILSAAATAQPPTTSTAAPAPQVAEPPAPPAVSATGDAPKTRAQVRDELSRARSNGTMSRFGNPDPYGPGGAPGRSAQPSVPTW
ncbi:hypothetical protein H3V53_05770 [Paraburkholderia bengalensis]|uniref:DUF4148 domain-containing protein n=1 Tax=Paraburkholderia bengalensis TaxID=2747562 RepID=A0ABU8IMK6_9BURK